MSSLEHVCRNFGAITLINLFSTKNWSYLHFVKILNISVLKVNIHHNEIQSIISLQPIFSYFFSPFANCWSHQVFSSLYFYTLIYDNKSYPKNSFPKNYWGSVFCPQFIFCPQFFLLFKTHFNFYLDILYLYCELLLDLDTVSTHFAF